MAELPCPEWETIRRNYVARTGRLIDRLMTRTAAPTDGGRLIVWHGAPGTGKSTAIRSLAREWSAWCDAYYLVDSDHLFNDPEYLADLIASTRHGSRSPTSPGGPKIQPAALLIAEDCDDYLHADAKLRAGAGLGRLLNLTDGLLSLGTKIIVLITTNEPVHKLHPALARPGRAMGVVEFGTFSAQEASEWGVSAARSSMTLAEMYGALADDELEAEPSGRPRIGFVAT